MKVGDLVRLHKTGCLGIVVEVFERQDRKPHVDREGNIFPPLVPIKVLFTETGEIRCMMDMHVKVIAHFI